MRRRSRPPRAVSAAVLSIALLLAAPGCSWLTTVPPPKDWDQRPYLYCSTNRAPAVIDTLFAVGSVGSTLYFGSRDSVENKPAALTAGLLVASVWFASALYGYMGSAECDDAMDKALARGYSYPRRGILYPRAARQPATPIPPPASPRTEPQAPAEPEGPIILPDNLPPAP